MDEKALDDYIDEIIKAKNLPGLTDDVKPILRDELKSELSDQINAALVDALGDEDQVKLDILLDDPNASDEQIQNFFVTTAGVNTTQIAARVMIEFRELYLEEKLSGE